MLWLAVVNAWGALVNMVAGTVWDDLISLDFQVFSTEQLLPKRWAPEHRAVWQHGVRVDQVQCSALAGKGSSSGSHCWGCGIDLEAGRWSEDSPKNGNRRSGSASLAVASLFLPNADCLLVRLSPCLLLGSPLQTAQCPPLSWLSSPPPQKCHLNPSCRV